MLDDEIPSKYQAGLKRIGDLHPVFASLALLTFSTKLPEKHLGCLF